jgi:hypothetical protein
MLALGRTDTAREAAQRAWQFSAAAAEAIADPELRRSFQRRSRLPPQLQALVDS